MAENHPLKQRNGSEQMDLNLLGLCWMVPIETNSYSPTNLEAGLGGGDGESGTAHGNQCFGGGGARGRKIHLPTITEGLEGGDGESGTVNTSGRGNGE